MSDPRDQAIIPLGNRPKNNPNTMKLCTLFLLTTYLSAFAETEERVNKRFPVQPHGTLTVDVDFGAIEVRTNGSNEVIVDVFRKVTRQTKAEEEAYLKERPVTFSQEDNNLKIESAAKRTISFSTHGRQRTEGKFTITVPAHFNAQLKTAGGGIAVGDVTGELNAKTSGGPLNFSHLHGSVDGRTAGGSIRLLDCHGDLKIKTSGGGIDMSGGSGSLNGDTSGGSITIKTFSGPVLVRSSGGGIEVDNVHGKLEGSTSGGSISANFSPLADEVNLKTSGGGVTLRLPENSAFDLDASTSGGNVSSDLPVSTTGKVPRGKLKGPVNGGGKAVVLHSGGGSIQVKKL
jgi:DUF4097 and DUF4098 domain-containing protein YvlB